MPRLTRRIAVRAGLAAGGTVGAVLIARKYPAMTPVVETVGPPPLRTLDAMQPLKPASKLAPFTWQSVAADGRVQARTIGDHAGQGVVLNIWATWCGPCTREMPSLARLAVVVASDRIAVLPVSIDQGGAGAVRAFYKAHAIEGLPVLIDPSSSVTSSLGVRGVPTTFLVGTEGRLRARFEGAADWSTPDAIASVRRLIGS